MTNHFDIVIYGLPNSNPMEGFGHRRDERTGLTVGIQQLSLLCV
jgi:hypothetical protein